MIDGIRIPAGSKLTVAPQDGVSEKPDFSTFSEVTFSRPVEWKGMEVNRMNRSAYQTEDGYQATLTMLSGKPGRLMWKGGLAGVTER